MINSGLFFAGLAAVSLPVIIHLLNRRRFKRVDWAAMDFLLEAQRLNRRRVKLEEFILLLLRCLAMVLIGLLLARPYFSSNPGANLFASGQTEHIIVLDDSLSMGAAADGKSAMEEASAMLTDFVEKLVASGSNDLLTVVRTTAPDRFSANGLPLTDDTTGQILDEFGALQPSDRAGDLGAALLHVEAGLKDDKASVNRIVYVLSDLRARDWEGSAAAGSDAGVVDTLKRIAATAAGCHVLELGAEGDANLVVESVASRDKAVIAGVPAEFEVTVRNAGGASANDVRVRFGAGETLPMEATIDSIAPGETGVAAFTYTFSSEPGEEAEAGGGTAAPEPVPVHVSLEPSPDAGADLLAADDERFYPARVVRGLRALVVDGDPSGLLGQGETYYLRHVLAPNGDALSGVEVTVVDDTEFDNVELDEFEVVLLANLYRVTARRVELLENWVEDGGGLVVLLGDQIDEDVYNDLLFKEGNGLLPSRLVAVEGDETEETWALLEPATNNHPLFRIFVGDLRQLLDGVKIFRWWRSEAAGSNAAAAADAEGRGDAENGDASDGDEAPGGGAAGDSSVRVLATLTDPGAAPAVVEKAYGEGKVMMWTTPMDADWGTFPENGGAFLITTQEMVRYMARDRSGEGSVAVGQPVKQYVDLREFRSEVSVIAPGEADGQPVAARLPEGATQESTVWEVDFDETEKRGIYEIKLQPSAGGEPRTEMFAANIDTGESALRRVSLSVLRGDLGDSGVGIVARGGRIGELGANAAKTEIWKLILYVLGGLLAVELLFGWWIGARR